MPICLIIPPSGFLLDERVFMSLGLLRVAAALERRGMAVELLDLSGIENYEEVARLHASASAATHFGITATTPQMPAAAKAAAAIRGVRPDARVILGGPHVTLVNAAVKGELKRGSAGAPGRAAQALDGLRRRFDVLVAGDGEEAIFKAIAPAAPPVIDADVPGTELFLTPAALNDLPLPARHLVDVSTYRYAVDGHRALSVIAQLGCPFECGFCGGRASPMLRRVRTRTSESIAAELVHLHEEYGVTGFMFYDDELNVNRQMVGLMRTIRTAQERLGTEWRLRGFVKAELFTEEQAREMYAAGFRWLLVGFESGAPRILENIRKRATQDENTRCLEIASAAGLKVKALMSIGHPGESHDTVMQTRDWLLAARPADFDLSLITTYPGTPYYDEAVPHARDAGVWTYTCRTNGDRLHAYNVDFTEVAEYYKGNPDGGYHAYVYTDHLSSAALVDLRDFVERDVRARLDIPFNPGAPSVRYEHSMGQRGPLPPTILRRSGPGAGAVDSAALSRPAQAPVSSDASRTREAGASGVRPHPGAGCGS
ncbi:MAG: B12-binding domain-containing radical SAM protein [Acidobacteria bacterium]|nr:B12-binding domain-containing radical SAM protein [Acidobacteriota bacterium]